MSAHQEDTAKLSSLIEKFRKPNSSITTYLNSAAESLFYQPHVDAFELYASCKTSGSEGRPELTKIENETRKLVANLIGVASETVISNVDHAVTFRSAIASSVFRNGLLGAAW